MIPLGWGIIVKQTRCNGLLLPGGQISACNNYMGFWELPFCDWLQFVIITYIKKDFYTSTLDFVIHKR
jgi:hypothetical protein